MNSYRRLKFLFLLMAGVFVIGCAHVPNATVLLSEELTGMIMSAEVAHMATIEMYITECRRQADAFLDSTWIPSFMGRMVEYSEVMEMLEAATSPMEKSQLMREFTIDAANEITARRESLMDAFDIIEHDLKQTVHAHYEDMLMVNAALTAHLRSAAKITETREELLALIRADPMEILPIDKIDAVVAKLITYEGKAEDVMGRVEEIREIIEAIEVEEE